MISNVFLCKNLQFFRIFANIG